MFRELTNEFILVGHVKDVQIDNNGEELSEMALDLVGKLSQIICGEQLKIIALKIIRHADCMPDDK